MKKQHILNVSTYVFFSSLYKSTKIRHTNFVFFVFLSLCSTYTHWFLKIKLVKNLILHPQAT